MPVIKKIEALEVLDSRGNPTIQVRLEVQSGFSGEFIVPSGASTGQHEAVELRDGDKNRYGGKGVLKAVDNVNKVIAPNVVDKFSVLEQLKMDEFLIGLDGTANKSKLGANAILGVSMAAAKARAAYNGKQLFEELMINKDDEILLPTPMMNIINGGAHADNGLDFQEFMIIPASSTSFKEALRAGVEIFHKLKQVLAEQGHSTSVGDEGGFAPKLKNNTHALEVITDAIEQAGYQAGRDVFLALDVASSEFYDSKKQVYQLKGKEFTSSQLIDFYEQLIERFAIISIEDGLDENDWQGYKEFTQRLGDRLQIVGDDFFVTNTQRLKQGIEGGMCNSILIKVNQIGTLSETLNAIKTAHEAGYTAIISHRSGETEDTSIADLAVATACGQIKTGSLCRTDRVAKYNRLLNIEHMCGGGTYKGASVLAGGKKS